MHKFLKDLSVKAQVVEETTLSPYIINFLDSDTKSIFLHLKQFADELWYLIIYSEKDQNFLEKFNSDIQSTKAALNKVLQVEKKSKKIISIYEALSNKLEISITNTITSIAYAQQDIDKVISALVDYVNDEKERVLFRIKQYSISKKFNYNELKWREDDDAHFSETKNCSGPLISFSNCIKSLPFKEIDIISNEIDNLFENNAQVLANMNNLQKCLVFIKISSNKIINLLKTYTYQIELKYHVYQQKSSSDEIRRVLFDQEKFEKFYQKVISIGNWLSSETKKLEAFIEILPLQCQKMCEKCVIFPYNIFNENKFLHEKLKHIKSACLSASQYLNSLVVKESPASILSLLRATRFIEQASSMENFTQNDIIISKEFKYSTSILYRMLHLRSELLRNLQLYALIKELDEKRKSLSEDMKIHIIDSPNAKEWENYIKIFAYDSFDFIKIESKIKSSRNIGSEGFHSYNSSWDLKIPKENISEISISKPSNNHSNSDWSESELSCSIKSGDDELDYQNKSNGKINYAEKIRNKLNEYAKKTHAKGIKGWKSDLKRLKNREKTQTSLDQSKAKIFLDESLFKTPKDEKSDLSTCSFTPNSIKNSFFSNKRTKTWKESSIRYSKTIISSSKRIKNVKSTVRDSVIRDEESLIRSVSLRKGRSTSKIENKLSRDLENLESYEGINIKGDFSKLQNYKGGFLRCRIRNIQRDRSISAIQKVNAIRDEFEKANMEEKKVRKPRSRLSKVNDSYLI
ncbi:unnamed protein product [Blepharisma stoltei]|uniref:DH domain-containing protein n=1 Tax=Blepharisma stoltei TaxID=1481888 RepID=A0AAU9ICW5_9CILI|nr:unnamed protein product [Blepharisma stoltei]